MSEQTMLIIVICNHVNNNSKEVNNKYVLIAITPGKQFDGVTKYNAIPEYIKIYMYNPEDV